MIKKIKELFWGKIKRNHPEVRKAIRPVFKIKGVQYYEFINPLDMPAERYLNLSQFIADNSIGIKREVHLKLLKRQQAYFDKGEITKAMIVNQDLQRHADNRLEINTLFQMASAVFFTLIDNEDLYSYDYDFNKKKIEDFKGQGVLDFFLKAPIGRYLGLSSISREDLKIYLKQTMVADEMSEKILNH